MNKLHIKVTREDIDLGQPGHITTCALARALKREFRTTDVMVAASNDIRVGRRRFEGSSAVDRFIESFDGNEPVRATTFALEEVTLA